MASELLSRRVQYAAGLRGQREAAGRDRVVPLGLLSGSRKWALGVRPTVVALVANGSSLSVALVTLDEML